MPRRSGFASFVSVRPGAKSPAEVTQMIKIGVVVATQGPVALLGTSFLKAVQLAKEDLASTRREYAIVTEEIASPGEAEPAIEKLINVEKVDSLIVGLSMSGQIAKKH